MSKLDELIELHDGHAEFWGTRNTLHRDTAEALRLCKKVVDKVAKWENNWVDESELDEMSTALAALRDAGMIGEA